MKRLKKLTIALLALLSFSATAWAAEESETITTVTATQLSYTGEHFTVKENNEVPDYADGSGLVISSPGSGQGSVTITSRNGENITMIELTYGYGEEQGYATTSTSGTVSSDGKTITDINATTVTISNTSGFTWTQVSEWKIYYGDAPASGPEVTISDAKDEASFEMPQNDVTVTYALKRDMTVDMATTVGDGTDGVRYRVQKQGNDFVPVGLTSAQVMALFNVHDDIEDADLTAATDYTVQIFAADEQGQPTGTAMTFQNFTYAPGQYIVKAVATEGSNYVGKTALSNVFTLYQGYEVTVPAGEYITYYQNEALTLDETETAAQLYTISSVTDTEAQLSEQLTVAPAETPLLVYNNSEETKTFLLIPTTTEETVSVAKEFKGTLEATTIPASTTSQDNYALNGKAFVWVKYEISIAANKCWLQIGEQPAATRANTRSITGSGDTTGIKGTDFTDYTDGDYYDLQGRKVSTPSKKGIYIKNGQKVIIK